MSASVEQLKMVADNLMACDDYMDRMKGTNSPINRRRVIHDYGKANGWGDIVDKIADRESIRKYIEDVEGLSKPDSDQMPTYNPYEMRAAKAAPSMASTNLSTNSKDNTAMNAITKTQAIEVTTQVNINGINIKSFTDSQLFGMIQQQEAEIKALQALENKPQSLLAEISKRQAGIDAVIGYMNDRDAKATVAAATAAAAA